MNFKMPGKVYRTAMSSLATSHMLIAAGTEDVQVRLCDIASGAFSHTLSGHRGMLVVQFCISIFLFRCVVSNNFYKHQPFWPIEHLMIPFMWS